jgi:hypothetical protein
MTVYEIWRWVPNYEGAYEVSNTGRVRSVDRTIHCYNWRAKKKMDMHVKGRLLRPGKGSHGYFTVSLGRHNTKTVHSLVADAFLGPKPENCEVLHNDGSRDNNHVSNLRYGTRSENNLDAVKHGTRDLAKLRLASQKGLALRWGKK